MSDIPLLEDHGEHQERPSGTTSLKRTCSPALAWIIILAPWLLVFLHLCHLRSTAMELLLPAILLCILVPLLGRGRIGLLFAFVISLGVTLAYLGWLHSPQFPQSLLDRRSLEVQQTKEDMRLIQQRRSGD